MFKKLNAIKLVGLFSIGFMTGCASYDPIFFQVEPDGKQATMNGVIDSRAPDIVRQFIDENPKVETLVMMNMPGSADDEANVVAARMIHQAKLNTHLTKNSEIASGAVDLYLAGINRTMERGAFVGVHSWGAGPGEPSAKELPNSAPEHQLYLDYYKDVKMPNPYRENFYFFTLCAAPAEGIHNMTEEEVVYFRMLTAPVIDTGGQPGNTANSKCSRTMRSHDS